MTETEKKIFSRRFAAETLPSNQNALKFHDAIFEKFNREPRFDGSSTSTLNPACHLSASIQNSLSPPTRLREREKKMRSCIRSKTINEHPQSSHACKGEGFKVSLRSLNGSKVAKHVGKKKKI
ncbi:hypothetical protein JTE90_011811 [Oedothorax gibbosus]|uniref:Uncharacterized protein n=1 Tax=Oedothorax gibbosus TaxID=931172 RepID=A0AAV6VV57_9ARAC|nr:hypothetical protein JTE90_011811 [Oedothorax gibbosus]